MKAPKILILDANTTYHVGNTALLDSSLEQLKSEFPDAKFTILAFDPISIAQMFGEHEVLECLWAKPFSSFSRPGKLIWLIREGLWMLINSVNFLLKKYIGVQFNSNFYTFSPTKRKVLSAYAEADIIVSISGEMLSDANQQRIGLFLYGYWLGYLMNKTVAIFPQSMGPFEKLFIKRVVKYVLECCDLILPRDKISLINVEKLNLSKPKVHLVPDVAVNQPCIPSAEATAELVGNGVYFERRPLIGITISKFKNNDFQKYFSVMRELCLFVTKELDGSIILFSPNLPYQNETSDLFFSEKLYNDLPDKTNLTLLSKLYSARQFKGLLGVCDAFITTRMHAAILATMNETPTITINTQPKLRGYMEMIGQDKWSCEISAFNNNSATKLLQEILKNNIEIKNTLREAKEKVGAQSLLATCYLKEIFIHKSNKNVD